MAATMARTPSATTAPRRMLEPTVNRLSVAGLVRAHGLVSVRAAKTAIVRQRAQNKANTRPDRTSAPTHPSADALSCMAVQPRPNTIKEKASVSGRPRLAASWSTQRLAVRAVMMPMSGRDTPRSNRAATHERPPRIGSASHCHHNNPSGPALRRKLVRPPVSRSRIHRSGSSLYQSSMCETVIGENSQYVPSLSAVRLKRTGWSLPSTASTATCSTRGGSPSSSLPPDAPDRVSMSISRRLSSTPLSRSARSRRLETLDAASDR